MFPGRCLSLVCRPCSNHTCFWGAQQSTDPFSYQPPSIAPQTLIPKDNGEQELCHSCGWVCFARFRPTMRFSSCGWCLVRAFCSSLPVPCLFCPGTYNNPLRLKNTQAIALQVM